MSKDIDSTAANTGQLKLQIRRIKTEQARAEVASSRSLLGSNEYRVLSRAIETKRRLEYYYTETEQLLTKKITKYEHLLAELDQRLLPSQLARRRLYLEWQITQTARESDLEALILTCEVDLLKLLLRDMEN